MVLVNVQRVVILVRTAHSVKVNVMNREEVVTNVPVIARKVFVTLDQGVCLDAEIHTTEQTVLDAKQPAKSATK